MQEALAWFVSQLAQWSACVCSPIDHNTLGANHRLRARLFAVVCTKRAHNVPHCSQTLQITLAVLLHPTATHQTELYIAAPQELEKHTAAFVEQSRVLATWDSAVLSNRHAMLDLETELRGVTAGQQALDKQLGMIETHQKVMTAKISTSLQSQAFQNRRTEGMHAGGRT
jgi:hypothetical protein